jgi:hypothetical protein
VITHTASPTILELDLIQKGCGGRADSYCPGTALHNLTLWPFVSLSCRWTVSHCKSFRSKRLATVNPALRRGVSMITDLISLLSAIPLQSRELRSVESLQQLRELRNLGLRPPDKVQYYCCIL